MAIGPSKVTISLLKGDPYGLRLVEKDVSNFTGIVVPRGEVAAAISEPSIASKKNGIYFLVGSTRNHPVEIYVGQTVKGPQRLQDHVNKKKFWEYACLWKAWILQNLQE